MPGFVGPAGLVRQTPLFFDVKFISVNLLKSSSDDASLELHYAIKPDSEDDPSAKPTISPVYDCLTNQEVQTDSSISGEFLRNNTAQICIGPFTPSEFTIKVIEDGVVQTGFQCSACAKPKSHSGSVDLEALAGEGASAVALDGEAGEIVLEVTRASSAPSGGLAILIGRAWDLPDVDNFSLSDPYVNIKVKDADGQILAQERTRTIESELNPVWDQIIVLPNPDSWKVESTVIELSIEDEDTVMDDHIAVVNMPLAQLIEQPNMKTLMYRSDASARVSHAPPHEPASICFSILEDTKPRTWPKSVPEKPWTEQTYPRHIFMMTRGTRGDVQPFVALARGMAENYGWLITICTELRWQSFVKEKSNVSRGRIRFRPSGGDTEAKMGEKMSQWALNTKTEIMQMIILANSEANFFDSSTVFMKHIEEMSIYEPRPVDMIIAGLTVVAVGSAIAEFLEIPVAGFILQPTCIPSKDKGWNAVTAIDSHTFGWQDWFEAKFFTGHKSLARLKKLSEENPFQMYNIRHIREWWGLEHHSSTWKYLQEKRMPFVIPIKPGTFNRPTDWWDEIVMTDFIFLRDKPAAAVSSASASMGEPLDSFLQKARAANANVGLMSFSSMPVSRKAMLQCATRMVEGCNFNMRLIYVGKRQPDTPPQDLVNKAASLEAEGRFIEVERADFGKLFKHMKFFIIQGGLGTTVEAFRCQKPIAVSGPLLLDQRWWGQVVQGKEVGPAPEEINRFKSEKFCVKFVNDALDPADPAGYQAKAREFDCGTEAEDGVKINIDAFKDILETGQGRVWEC